MSISEDLGVEGGGLKRQEQMIGIELEIYIISAHIEKYLKLHRH